MNIDDFFPEDEHGITGSEPAPPDLSVYLHPLSQIQAKLHTYLKQHGTVASLSSKHNINYDPNVIDDLELIKPWWVNGFEKLDKDDGRMVHTLTDILAHVYIQLYYIQYHRHQKRNLAFERKCSMSMKYDYTLVVHACCSLAALAGCRHVHIMTNPNTIEANYQAITIIATTTKPKTFKEIEWEKEQALKRKKQLQPSDKWKMPTKLDRVLPTPFPSLDDMDRFINDTHLGYINLWYYYRQGTSSSLSTQQQQLIDDPTSSSSDVQWEIVEQVTSHIQKLISEWETKMEQREKRREMLEQQPSSSLSLSSSSSFSSSSSSSTRPEDIGGKLPSEWIPPIDESLIQLRCLHTNVRRDEQPIHHGNYLWKRDPIETIKRLPIIQSYILAQIVMEHKLLNQFTHVYPFEHESPCPDSVLKWKNYATSKQLFQQWVLEYCLNKQLGDNFTDTLKRITFEHLLPLGARPLGLRVEGRTMTPDILFRGLVGHAATLYIARLLDDPYSYRHIAYTPTHPLYPYVLLTVLQFSFQQQDVLKSWYETCVVKSSYLLYKSQAEDRFCQQEEQNRARLPLLVILTGKWCIHTFSSSTTTHQPQWYICEDSTEWILTWLMLVQLQCPNRRLPQTTSIDWWFERFQL